MTHSLLLKRELMELAAVIPGDPTCIWALAMLELWHHDSAEPSSADRGRRPV